MDWLCGMVPIGESVQPLRRTFMNLILFIVALRVCHDHGEYATREPSIM